MIRGLWRRLFRREALQPIPSTPRVLMVLDDGAEIDLPSHGHVAYVAKSLISPHNGR